MKQLLSLLLGAAIVASAWGYTFGVPDQIRAFLPVQSEDTQEQTASEPSVGGSPGRRPGGRPGAGSGATVVTKAEVALEPYVDTFRSVGTAKAQATVTVEAEVSGKVTDVHFGANQMINAGDALVSLDDQVEQIALRSAKASLSEAEATLERYTMLRESNSGVVASVTVTEAETQVEIARANLAKAEYDLEQKTIRAPISGTLGLSDVEPGVYLAAGSEIVNITDQSRLTVEFGLPDRAASSIAVGQNVRLVTGSMVGRIFEGVVEGFDGQIDATTRTIKVRAGIDNEDGALLPGVIFNVMLAEPNAPLPRVPANAITWSRDGASVWRIVDGKAERVQVEIRHRANDMVWLEADLEAGQQVVVEGVQKLREGASVGTAEEVANMPASTGRPERGERGQRPVGNRPTDPTGTTPEGGASAAEGQVPSGGDRPGAALAVEGRAE